MRNNWPNLTTKNISLKLTLSIMSIQRPLWRESSLLIGITKNKNIHKIQSLKQRSKINKDNHCKNQNKENQTKFRILMFYRESTSMSSSQPKSPNTISSTSPSSTNQIKSTSIFSRLPKNFKNQINKKDLSRKILLRNCSNKIFSPKD